MTIDLGRPALITVDFQNDFVHPDGKAGQVGADVSPLLDALHGANRLIDRGRQASIPIVFVRVTHSPTLDNPAYRDRYAARGMSPDDLLCADGSWGAEFHSELRPPQATELVATKHAYDGFSVDELPEHLSRLDVDTVIVAGVVTELCVMGTVAGAFEHGLRVVVPREATGTTDPAAAEAALKLIASFYGTVASIDEVVAALETRAAASVIS